MRIGIPDDYQNCLSSLECFSMLSAHEVTIVNDYFPNSRDLVAELNNPEALVLTRTRTIVDEMLLKQLTSLKVISQTGKNAGHIDVEACKKYGVEILESNGNPIATAELTWALIMNGLRLIPQAISGMQAGHWQTNIGRRVFGKKIGIWGYGKIGKRIAQYAKVFGAEVIVHGSESSRIAASNDGFLETGNKEDFFSSCDVITLHLRLNEETRGIIRSSDLRAMKEDALLVNTSRAELIEKMALESALEAGRPGFAAVDVYDVEPIYDASYPLLRMPNVICTPHLGYVEREGYELYFGQAFSNLIAWEKNRS